jgi:lipocalin
MERRIFNSPAEAAEACYLCLPGIEKDRVVKYFNKVYFSSLDMIRNINGSSELSEEDRQLSLDVSYQQTITMLKYSRFPDKKRKPGKALKHSELNFQGF